MKASKFRAAFVPEATKLPQSFTTRILTSHAVLDPFKCHEDMLFLLIAVTLFVRAVAQDTTTFDPSSIDVATKCMFSGFLARKLRSLRY